MRFVGQTERFNEANSHTNENFQHIYSYRRMFFFLVVNDIYLACQDNIIFVYDAIS